MLVPDASGNSIVENRRAKFSAKSSSVRLVYLSFKRPQRVSKKDLCAVLFEIIKPFLPSRTSRSERFSTPLKTRVLFIDSIFWARYE